MDEPHRELVQEWLEKARRDLRGARKLIEEPDYLFDLAMFHCQQAAEKALKGFLVCHNIRFAKTHDIGALLDLAAQVDGSLQEFLPDARSLTRYSTDIRYPKGMREPEPIDFREAFSLAERIYQRVLALLPEETHP